MIFNNKLMILFFFFLIFFSCVIKNNPNNRNVIYYYINYNANEESQIAVLRAFKIWEDAMDNKIKFVYKKRNRAGIIRDNKNTVSFIKVFPKNINQTNIAYCHNWYKNKKIIESDIIFNMSLVKWTTYDKKKDDSYCIEGILLHEIGHMLSLGHIDCEGSIMKQRQSISDSYKIKIDNCTIDKIKKNNIIGKQ